ncbi:DUF2750 domain-containing protein [Thalassotalea maritima]|uniref:DUF2750 domain-containing protein n=1 Tax=Thalassotalea maritima TaxID=3242416 RepID=UPI003527B0E2
MSNETEQFTPFVDMVNEEEKLFALQAEDGEWVVCDSAFYEDADVMPLWGSAEDANKFCVDEWADYQVAEIPLETFLEEWVSDLNDDGVLIGVNWQLDENAEEMDAIEFAKLLVKAF